MRFFLLAVLTLLPFAAAADTPEYTLSIRNHRYVPSELTIPANTKVKLLVVNEDATPEEFESHELNREKIVTGKATITVYVGPLKPGRYPFFGDFHQDTAQGALIAADPNLSEVQRISIVRKKIPERKTMALPLLAFRRLALAGAADKVYTPIVEKGETEIEFRGG